jgi:hypothetical protein
MPLPWELETLSGCWMLEDEAGLSPSGDRFQTMTDYVIKEISLIEPSVQGNQAKQLLKVLSTTMQSLINTWAADDASDARRVMNESLRMKWRDEFIRINWRNRWNALAAIIDDMRMALKDTASTATTVEGATKGSVP